MPVATRSMLQAAGNNGLLLPCLQMHSSSRQTSGCRFCTKIERRGKDEWEVSLSRADLRSLHLLFRSNFRIDQSFKPRRAFSSPAKFSLSTAPLAAGFSASATSISLTSRLVLSLYFERTNLLLLRIICLTKFSTVLFPLLRPICIFL